MRRMRPKLPVGGYLAQTPERRIPRQRIPIFAPEHEMGRYDRHKPFGLI